MLVRLGVSCLIRLAHRDRSGAGIHSLRPRLEFTRTAAHRCGRTIDIGPPPTEPNDRKAAAGPDRRGGHEIRLSPVTGAGSILVPVDDRARPPQLSAAELLVRRRHLSARPVRANGRRLKAKVRGDVRGRPPLRLRARTLGVRRRHRYSPCLACRADHALRTIASRLDRRGFQPSSVIALDGSATSAAGSRAGGS